MGQQRQRKDTKVRELSEKTNPEGFGVEPTWAAATGTSAVGFPFVISY